MSKLASHMHRLQERVRGLMARSEDKVVLALTLVIGAVVGLVVVAFIVVTDSLNALLYPEGGARWRYLVIPLVVTLGVGYLLYRFFPQARGSGVPQTKAALFARKGYISFRTVVGKFFCSSTTLASGIALGREGPSVQIGAGLASVIGRAVGLPPDKIESLVPVGAAAALAAAFNTPIAAVLFAMEEVVGNLHLRVLGSIVPGVVTAWLVLHLLLGDEPLFHVPEYEVVHPAEFGIYAILGVIGGLVSVLFVKMVLRMRERFLNMPRKTLAFQPAFGGLVFGLMALWLPTLFGVSYGYAQVGAALNGNLALTMMALLVVLKVFATTTSYASGNAGGIFGPSLFIGAMVGGTVGSVANLLFEDLTAEPGAYALVGMGTAFAGILRVPITSVIMIWEITDDYHIIPPLMISNLISFFVSYRLQRQPIYEALSLQEGIHLPTAEVSQRHIQVRVAMRPPRELFAPDMTVTEALTQAGHSSLRSWPVADKRGLWGIVSLAQLESATEKQSSEAKVGDLLDTRTFPHLHADHSLDLALERMGKSGFDLLPVVSRANVHDLEGVVTLLDVLRAFGLQEPTAERGGAKKRESS